MTVPTSTTTKSSTKAQASDPGRDSLAEAMDCAQAVISKKGLNTIILNLGDKSPMADYFVISSGTSERQVQAMADAVVQSQKSKGTLPRVEGYTEGRWVLIDAGNIVVHLFHEDLRQYYRLEELWSHAPRVEIPREFYLNIS